MPSPSLEKSRKFWVNLSVFLRKNALHIPKPFNSKDPHRRHPAPVQNASTRVVWCFMTDLPVVLNAKSKHWGILSYWFPTPQTHFNQPTISLTPKPCSWIALKIFRRCVPFAYSLEIYRRKLKNIGSRSWVELKFAAQSSEARLTVTSNIMAILFLIGK